MGLRGFPQFGPRGSEVGASITGTTPDITSPVHFVLTTAELTTLTPPLAILKDVLPVYLVAGSIFKWTTSGNIAGVPGTTLLAGHAYGFIYERSTGKWYPMGLPAVAS